MEELFLGKDSGVGGAPAAEDGAAAPTQKRTTSAVVYGHSWSRCSFSLRHDAEPPCPGDAPESRSPRGGKERGAAIKKNCCRKLSREIGRLAAIVGSETSTKDAIFFRI